MRILIVDDDAQIRAVLRRKLLQLGYTDDRGHRVDAAVDGSECLTLASEAPVPDVILMDGNLTYETGPAVVRALRVAGCTAKIIMMSSDGDRNTEGIAAGADAIWEEKSNLPEHFAVILSRLGLAS